MVWGIWVPPSDVAPWLEKVGHDPNDSICRRLLLEPFNAGPNYLHKQGPCATDEQGMGHECTNSVFLIFVFQTGRSP